MNNSQTNNNFAENSTKLNLSLPTILFFNSKFPFPPSGNLHFSQKIYFTETVVMKHKKDKNIIEDITTVLKLIVALLDVIASFIGLL